MLGVDEKECVQACQSSLWGGTGVSSYDDAGTCSCSCEEGWKTFDIVGHASCIPSSAYNTFGYVGLILTLAHFIHAAYNVKQQRHSEAVQCSRGMVVKKLVDVYRGQLGVLSIAHAPVIGLYFALTLWLPAESVRWSALVLGASHSLSGIGAVLTVQVLIRSVDPRLLKKDAFVLNVSAALTHPVGRAISFSVVSTGGTFLICMASIDGTGQGYMIASIAYIIVTVTRIVVIIMCSRSMVQMIDRSMKRHAAKQRADGAARAGAEGGDVKVDPKLVAARKTILSALFFCIKLTSVASAVLIFALVTEYGSDNPIVFLATPLAFGPMIALSFHIQLHSKRNKLSPVSPQSPNSAINSANVSSRGATNSHHPSLRNTYDQLPGHRGSPNASSHMVVPMETPVEAANLGGEDRSLASMAEEKEPAMA